MLPVALFLDYGYGGGTGFDHCMGTLILEWHAHPKANMSGMIATISS